MVNKDGTKLPAPETGNKAAEMPPILDELHRDFGFPKEGIPDVKTDPAFVPAAPQTEYQEAIEAWKHQQGEIPPKPPFSIRLRNNFYRIYDYVCGRKEIEDESKGIVVFPAAQNELPNQERNATLDEIITAPETRTEATIEPEHGITQQDIDELPKEYVRPAVEQKETVEDVVEATPKRIYEAPNIILQEKKEHLTTTQVEQWQLEEFMQPLETAEAPKLEERVTMWQRAKLAKPELIGIGLAVGVYFASWLVADRIVDKTPIEQPKPAISQQVKPEPQNVLPKITQPTVTPSPVKTTYVNERVGLVNRVAEALKEDTKRPGSKYTLYDEIPAYLSDVTGKIAFDRTHENEAVISIKKNTTNMTLEVTLHNYRTFKSQNPLAFLVESSTTKDKIPGEFEEQKDGTGKAVLNLCALDDAGLTENEITTAIVEMPAVAIHEDGHDVAPRIYKASVRGDANKLLAQKTMAQLNNGAAAYTNAQNTKQSAISNVRNGSIDNVLGNPTDFGKFESKPAATLPTRDGVQSRYAPNSFYASLQRAGADEATISNIRSDIAKEYATSTRTVKELAEQYKISATTFSRLAKKELADRKIYVNSRKEARVAYA